MAYAKPGVRKAYLLLWLLFTAAAPVALAIFASRTFEAQGEKTRESLDALSNVATYAAVAMAGVYFVYQAVSGRTMNPGMVVEVTTERSRRPNSNQDWLAIHVRLAGGDAGSVRLHDVAVDVQPLEPSAVDANAAPAVAANAMRTGRRLANENLLRELRTTKRTSKTDALRGYHHIAVPAGITAPPERPGAGAKPSAPPEECYREENFVLSPGDTISLTWLDAVARDAPVRVDVTVVGRRHPVDLHGYIPQWRSYTISLPRAEQEPTVRV